jgi:hypothetical protein
VFVFYYINSPLIIIPCKKYQSNQVNLHLKKSSDEFRLFINHFVFLQGFGEERKNKNEKGAIRKG